MTPDPARADAPVALSDGLGSTLHLFYADQAGHVINALSQSGSSVLAKQQIGTVVAAGPISTSSHGISAEVLDSTGQVWLAGNGSSQFVSLGGYLKEARLLPQGGGLMMVGEDASGALWWRSQDGDSGKLVAWRRLGITLAPGGSLLDLSLFSFATSPYGVGNIADGTAQFFGMGGSLPNLNVVTSPLSIGTFEVLGVADTFGDFAKVFAYDSGAGQPYLRTVTGGTTDTWQPLRPLALAANQPVSVTGTLPNFTATAVAALGVDGFIYVTSNYSGAGATFGPWQKVSTQPAATPPTLLADNGSRAYLVFRGQDGQLYRYLAPLSTTQAPLSFTGGRCGSRDGSPRRRAVRRGDPFVQPFNMPSRRSRRWSNEDRSGTVQPFRSYSLRHSSTKAL